MSASQKTTNYNLPLFAPEDVTDWLTDFNGAMSMIDEDLHGLASSITKTQITSGELDTRVGALEGEYNTLNSQVTNNSSSLSNLTQRTTTNEEAIQNLEHEYEDLSGEVAQNEANITSQQGTLSSLDTTVQNQVETVNQHTAEIEELKTILNEKLVCCGIFEIIFYGRNSQKPQDPGITVTKYSTHSFPVIGTDANADCYIKEIKISGQIEPTDKLVGVLMPQTNPVSQFPVSGTNYALYNQLEYKNNVPFNGTNKIEDKGKTLSELAINESEGKGGQYMTASVFTRFILGIENSESDYGVIPRVVNPSSNDASPSPYSMIFYGLVFKKI